ncbi:hypothetical protein GGF46_004590 [Coemansia sp. RSA 552]|nr:hypothetical protein GGF46_004590 [Coemansia sp. RSA 552]
MPPRPMPSAPESRRELQQQSEARQPPLSAPPSSNFYSAVVETGSIHSTQPPPEYSADPSLVPLLEDAFVDGGALDWPFAQDDGAGYTSAPPPPATNPPVPEADSVTLGAVGDVGGSSKPTATPAQDSTMAPPYAADEKTRSGMLELPPSDGEEITYQYALRYAILLDADSAQLAARSRSVTASPSAGKKPELSRAGSELNNGFSMMTMGKASGAPNLSNRTPTLIYPNGGQGAVAESSTRARSRSWKNSLLEFGDSAARKIKAEITSSSSGSKLKAFGRGGGSDVPGSRPSRSARPGGLTPAIVKALTQQLKTAANAPSLHPFTRETYMDLYTYLRVKEHGETVGEHGTIDVLLSLFADRSRAVCNQHGISNPADIDRTVESQKTLFIKLLRSVLQSKARTSREAGQALIKLDDYLDDSTAGSSGPAVNSGIPSPRPSSCEAPGSISFDEDAVSTAEQQNKLTTTWLRQAFNVPESEHQLCLKELRKEVDQETATQDLRLCMMVLKRDQSFSGKPGEFRSAQAYRKWKDREVIQLEQLISSSMVRPRYMMGENISAGRLKLDVSVIEAMGTEALAEAFEYIPTRAMSHYRQMVLTAVRHDIVRNVKPGSPDTVIPLSKIATQLLSQLSDSWRISAPYSKTCYLDAINRHYIQGDLPIKYLLEAFGKIDRFVHLIDPQEWHLLHYNYLEAVQGTIEYRALEAVRGVVEDLDHQRPETSASLKQLLRTLVVNDVGCPALLNKPLPAVAGRRELVVEALTPAINYRCDCLDQQCFSDETSLSPRLDGYAQLAELVLCDYERCCKIFGDTLLEDGDRRFDISGIVAEVETEYFHTNLKRHLDQFGYTVDNSDIETALELCKSITRIEELHAKYSTRELAAVDRRRLFREAASAWLANIDSEKVKWAENALKQDSSPRELDIGKHSTSVIDLVSCFSQQASAVQRLKWPDMETKAWFLTAFMKYVSISFEVYAQVMLNQFLNCLSAPPAASADADAAKKSPMWNSMWNSRKYKEQSLNLSAATQAALSMLDQAHPLLVTAEACTRLNNLSIALEKLYELQEDLGVRDVVEALGGENRPSMQEFDPTKYLLSFKVIRSEGLELYKRQYDTSVDKTTRPYVKLAVTWQTNDDVAKRHTFAKTRPAPAGSVNFRWNESFDRRMDSHDEIMTPLEARVCTRDGPKRMGFKEKTRARAFFALPTKLTSGVDSSIDVVLDLEPAGHLLLQVTVDGERDDVEFYSGRMFRFIGRTLSDMQQRIVEQVTVGIREYLRQILVSQPTRYRNSRVITPSHIGLDRGIDRSIQFLKRGGHQAPATIRVTQESCCEALIPLIDYLEDNLHTLFIHLYDDMANGVIAKVWNEVLVTLEDILLPPLRGTSKGGAKPMTETDLTNVFDCLEFLKWYFEGGSDKDGIPSDVLESRRYHELVDVRAMYFMMTRELIDEYMREMHQSAGTTRSAESIARRISNAADTDPLPPKELPQIPLSADAGGAFPRPISGVQNPLPALPERPALPPRPCSSFNGPDNQRSSRRFSVHADMAAGDNSSTDTLPLAATQDVRAAIIPTASAAGVKKSTLSRNRSVWAHKDAATLRRFRRNHRMVTDKGDLILRLLRLRFDKEAPKFVQTQLELRTRQMQYEMRRAAKRFQETQQ